jgi:hypothetical protein
MNMFAQKFTLYVILSLMALAYPVSKSLLARAQHIEFSLAASRPLKSENYT